MTDDEAERNAALIALDIEWARRNAHENWDPSRNFPGDDVLMTSMHKARVEIVAMPAELRLASVEWLRAGGLLRWNGMALPPPGVLPQ